MERTELRDFKTKFQRILFTNSLQIIKEPFMFLHLKPFFGYTSHHTTVRYE